MTSVILFIFGLIIGSFINVMGLRWNSGVSLGGRSFCPRCGHKLNWHELVPVVSFMFQAGRCRSCRARISWQYPLVEIWTGLIFVSIYNLQVTTYSKLVLGIVFCIFVVITIYDLRHKIIPDSLVYAAIVFAVAGRWLSAGSTHDYLAGPLLFVFFALVWLITRGRAMGFGDAKLALAIGLLLGAAVGYSAVVLAFWIGAFFAIAFLISARFLPLLRKGKRITMKSEIPFAPFLVAGAWLALIFDLDLLHVAFF
jgi:prepilin signal peptidase PulO-like enzyme (type II secretory pathway)